MTILEHLAEKQIWIHNKQPCYCGAEVAAKPDDIYLLRQAEKIRKQLRREKIKLTTGHALSLHRDFFPGFRIDIGDIIGYRHINDFYECNMGVCAKT